MLLAVDIGNSNVSCGIFRGKRLIKQFDIPTNACSKERFSQKIIKPSIISESVICTVVPKKTEVLLSVLKSLTGKTPYVIGRDLPVPIKNLYRSPKQLGQDRLVNAYAASVLYQKPSIIIDSGTAITFDLVSSKGQYLGGLIFPGMGISLKSLKENTALLPLVKLSNPIGLIGRNTRDSILNGVVLGTAELCSGLIQRIKQDIGRACPVIGTGGDILRIKKYSKANIRIDKNLTLKGISLTYKYGIKRSI